MHKTSEIAYETEKALTFFSFLRSLTLISKLKLKKLKEPKASPNKDFLTVAFYFRFEIEGLKMRWSKREGFHVANLFEPACTSYEEAMSFYKTGVFNKVKCFRQIFQL